MQLKSGILIFIFGLVGAACASRPIKKVESSTHLPGEVPLEFENKFEVKPIHQGTPEIPNKEEITQGTDQKIPKAWVDKNSEKAKSLKVSKKNKEKQKKFSDIIEPEQKPDKPKFNYPNIRPLREPVWVGEKAVYEMSYFGMVAGDFTAEVMPFKEINQRKVYHFKGTAVTSPMFNVFYRLNDTVESFVDYEGLFSHRFHVVLDESKQSRDALELYDPEKSQTYYWNRHSRKDLPYIETKDFFPMAPFSQDSFSSLFYLRMVPLPDGRIFSFNVTSEGKTFDTEVTVVRREMLETVLGRVPTVVVKPEPHFPQPGKKRAESYIWFTDDERRICVRLEAQVKIGTIVAKLKSFELGNAP